MADMNPFGAPAPASQTGPNAFGSNPVNVPPSGVEGDTTPSYYGAPPTTMIRTPMKGGPGRVVSPFPMGAGGAARTTKPPVQYPGMDIPSLPDFIMRQVMSNDNQHNTVANLKDTDLMDYARQYAETHTGVFDAAGDKMDKNIRDSLVDQFQNTVYQNLPKLKAFLADQEAKQRGTAAPAANAPYSLTSNPVTDFLTGAVAGIPKALGGAEALGTTYVTNPLRRAAAAAGLRPDLTPESIKSTEAADLGQASKIYQTGEEFENKHLTPQALAANKEVAENTQKFNADPKNNLLDKIGNTLSNFISHPAAIPHTIGEFATPIGEAGLIEKGVAGAAIGNVLKKTAQNIPFAIQQAGTLPIQVWDRAKAENLTDEQALEAAKKAAYSPEAAAAVFAMLAPIGTVKQTGAALKGVTGVATRTVGQGVQFGAAAAASKRAENIAAGKPPNEGIDDAFAGGAAQAIPLTAGYEAFHAVLRKPSVTPKQAAQQPPVKPGETPPPAKPGSPPPGGVSGPSPEAIKAFNDTINNFKVPAGASPDTVKATLAEALDELEVRLQAHDVPEDSIETAKKAFEARWKRENNIPVDVTTPPVSEATQPTAAEAQQATSSGPITRPMAIQLKNLGFTDEQISKLTPEQAWDHINGNAGPAAATPSPLEAEAAAAAKSIPTPGEETPPGEAAPAPAGAAPIPTGTEVAPAAPTPAPAPAMSPGEARAAMPEPVPPSHRELATHPGVDPRLPVGLTQRVVQELRGSGREPTPEDINRRAHAIMDMAGVDVTDIHRREALGELLEKNPIELPTKEEITKKAGELLDTKNKHSAQNIINERLQERENHPSQRIRDVLRRSKELVDEQNRKKAEDDKKAAEEAAVQQRKKEYEAQRPKVEADEVAAEEQRIKDEAEKKLQEDLNDFRKAKAAAEAKKTAAAEKKVNALKKKTLAEKAAADKAAAEEKAAADKPVETTPAKPNILKRALGKITAPIKPPETKKGEAVAAAKQKTAAKPSYARREPLPLYSAVQRFVDHPVGVPDLKTSVAWKKWFNNGRSRGMFKDSEYKYLGVDTFLDDKKDIALSDIQRFIRDSNRIRIDVQTIREGEDVLNPQEREEYVHLAIKVANEKGKPQLTDEEWNRYRDLILKEKVGARVAQWGPTDRESYDYINWPGGENYEEHLLHERDVLTQDEISAQKDFLTEKMRELRYVSGHTPLTKSQTKELADLHTEENTIQNEMYSESVTRSPHFPWVRNPIGHLRTEQREAINTDTSDFTKLQPPIKVQHISEFQAEGHQQARKIENGKPLGYKPSKDIIEQIIRERNEAETLYQNERNKLYALNNKHEEERLPLQRKLNERFSKIESLAQKARFNLSMYKDKRLYEVEEIFENRDKVYQDTKKELQELSEKQENSDEIKNLRTNIDKYREQSRIKGRELSSYNDAVADIPFKTDEEWVLALFKQALKRAIETGQDAISWTTGIQQTDRYNLGRKTESVNVLKKEDGDTSLSVSLEGGKQTTFRIDQDGLIRDLRNWPGAKGDSLENKPLKYAFGKEKAEEIMSAPEGATIDTAGIYIGPKFHRQIYDEVAPKVIGDYVKQWGGKVTRAEEPNSIKFNLERTDKQKERERFYSINRQIPHGETAVHSIRITPEMREDILGKEQPAFAKRETVERTPYSLPEGLFTKDSALSNLLSERISSWTPKTPVKFETVDERSLPSDLQDAVKAFSATGTRVVFVKNLTPHVNTFEGVNFGDRLLFIDEAAGHPIVSLVSHEFIHDLQANHPELYAKLDAEIQRQLKEAGTESAWKDNLISRGYENLNDVGVRAELAANAAGDAFADPKFLRALADRNPSVFRNIANTFINYINKLLSKVGIVKDLQSNKYLHDLDDFRTKLLDVLGQYNPPESRRLLAQSTALNKGMFARRPVVTTAEQAHAAAKDWEVAPTTLSSLLPHKGPDTLEPSRWQKLARIMSNTIQPLQHYNEYQARQGKPVKDDANMYKSFTILRGRQIFEQSVDHSNYIAPFEDALRNTAEQTGVKEDKLLSQFSRWIRAKSALEVNKRYELENIGLTQAAEAKRSALKLATRDGSFKGNYLQELKNIVYAPGAKVDKTVEPAAGMSNVEAYQLLNDVNKEGFDNETGESLNKVLDPLRNRVGENQLRSGSFSPADIRMQKAYESKYYTPNSDWADEDTRTPENVFGSPLGIFTKAAYKGKETPKDDPLQGLFNRLLFSAKDVADNEATESIRQAVLDPNQNLNGTIRTYDMDKLTEDSMKGGAKINNMMRLFKQPNTIIHNRGKLRDVITLPEDSPVLRAIKESQHPIELGAVHATIGKFTGLYGRFHTALSPSFAMVNAAVRDGLYIPGMMVWQGRLDLIPGYIGNYMRFGGPLGAWKSAFTFGETGLRIKTFAEAEKYALDNPDSFAGKLYQLDKAGGGFNFRDEFNNAKRLEKFRDEIMKQNQNVLDPRRIGRNILKLQDAVATGSMMAGRVAAFESALGRDMSVKDAAFYSKRLLDYQQTSEGSRILNSWFAFSRVGITSVDAMFSALKNEKGQIDAKRAMLGMMIMGTATAGLYGAIRSSMGDDKSKKLSDDALAKNVIIPNGTDTPYQLPIGLGMPRLTWGLAMMATRLAEGHTTAASAGRTIKNLLLENVSPLHPIESKEGADAGTNAADLAGALVPSIARPGYESFINQTAFGTQIHESPEYTTGYASESGRITTADMYKEIARSMRVHTGLDVYPETIRHILSSYDPGALNLLLKNLEKEDMAAAGLDVDASQGTIFSALFNHDLKYATGKEYYAAKLDLEDAKKQGDLLRKADKPIPAPIQSKIDLDKEFIKASKEHSKARKAVTDNVLLSTAARTSKLAAVQQAWEKTQQELVKQAH